MARNSSSGSLKGQEAAAGGGRLQQQQHLLRGGKQGSGRAGYGGNSGLRLEATPSKITITEQGIVFEVRTQHCGCMKGRTRSLQGTQQQLCH
jgi:hypothetical protein